MAFPGQISWQQKQVMEVPGSTWGVSHSERNQYKFILILSASWHINQMEVAANTGDLYSAFT
jgi:hypothetical protein